MKKIGYAAIRLFFGLGLLFLSLGVTGCYQFVAEHPEKTEKEFYEDQAFCESEARSYALERYEDLTHSEEINHARRCMRGLGWEYHFRKKAGDTSDDE
ncbi:MAG: hypothetical protein V6Z89_04250 [Desulfobacter sp.]